jgi:hypothetical protein
VSSDAAAKERGAMTDTDDPVRQFREALPGFARRDLTLTVEAIVDIRAAVELGHDPAELAHLVAYHTAGLDNGDAVMRWRLHRYAGHDDLDEQK